MVNSAFSTVLSSPLQSQTSRAGVWLMCAKPPLQVQGTWFWHGVKPSPWTTSVHPQEPSPVANHPQFVVTISGGLHCPVLSVPHIHKNKKVKINWTQGYSQHSNWSRLGCLYSRDNETKLYIISVFLYHRFRKNKNHDKKQKFLI